MKRAKTYPAGHRIAGTSYRVVRVLGAGGMGTVYEVEDESVGRAYVLKTLHPELGNREDLAARMDREARVLAKLAHPNIVQVITAGVTKDEYGLRFFVMEKLEGYSLRTIFRHARALGLKKTYTIAIDLFAALQHAHDHDIVHRDVKPENIFLCRNYEAKLLDFGIFTLSKPTHFTEPRFIGTYKYASPEQLIGKEKLTGASDVYSAGCVLYEMIAGQHPFETVGATDQDFAGAHLHAEPPPITLWAEVPPELAKLVHQCLAKKASERPDAFTVASTLRRLQRQWENEQPPDPTLRVTDEDQITRVDEASRAPRRPDRTEPDAPIFARSSRGRTAPMDDNTVPEPLDPAIFAEHANAAEPEPAPAHLVADLEPTMLARTNARTTRIEVPARRIQNEATNSSPPEAAILAQAPPVSDRSPASGSGRVYLDEEKLRRLDSEPIAIREPRPERSPRAASAPGVARSILANRRARVDPRDLLLAVAGGVTVAIAIAFWLSSRDRVPLSTSAASVSATTSSMPAESAVPASSSTSIPTSPSAAEASASAIDSPSRPMASAVASAPSLPLKPPPPSPVARSKSTPDDELERTLRLMSDLLAPKPEPKPSAPSRIFTEPLLDPTTSPAASSKRTPTAPPPSSKKQSDRPGPGF